MQITRESDLLQKLRFYNQKANLYLERLSIEMNSGSHLEFKAIPKDLAKMSSSFLSFLSDSEKKVWRVYGFALCSRFYDPAKSLFLPN